MRKINIPSVIYFFVMILCLASCSSCSKVSNPNSPEYSYEDFKSVKDNDCDNNPEPLYEKEYDIKLRVIRRVYLI